MRMHHSLALLIVLCRASAGKLKGYEVVLEEVIVADYRQRVSP
jgi:hypothetical protein